MDLRALGVVALLAFIPGGSAEAECAAPCGYINPIVDLNFPLKKDCGAVNVLGAEPTPEDCMTPPRDAPVVLDGTLRWYWDVSYDGTYPADPNEPIEITFGTTETNPSWIDVAVEPASFLIDNTVLFNPENMKTTFNDDGTSQTYFWFERPITVTFTRGGEPTEEEVKKMDSRDGVQTLFVKVRSTSSGDQYKEAYGIEQFRFHGENDADVAPRLDKGMPMPSILFLAAALLFVRRRQDVDPPAL